MKFLFLCKKFFTAFLIVELIVLTLLMFHFDAKTTNNFEEFTKNRSNPLIVNSKQSYIDHAPIYINSDDDFESLGFQGNGTLDDPYIIENLRIETENNNGIFIEFTTKSYIIRNCFIDALSSSIYIADMTSTFKIENNILISTYNGIFISEAYDSIIYNNTFVESKIHIVSGHFLEIENCTFFHTIDESILIESSNDISITGNTFISSYEGITFKNVDNSIIETNSFFYTTNYSIFLDYQSEVNYIFRNKFLKNEANSFSQAYDAGTGNEWQNTTISEGNYWSDWSGVGDYLIDGPTGNYDSDPLIFNYIDTNKPIIVDFSCDFLIEEEKIIAQIVTFDEIGISNVSIYLEIIDDMNSYWLNYTIEQKNDYSYYLDIPFSEKNYTVNYFFEVIDSSNNQIKTRIYNKSIQQPTTPLLHEIPANTPPGYFNLTWDPSIDSDGKIEYYYIETTDDIYDWENSAVYAQWTVDGNQTYVEVELYDSVWGAYPYQYFRVKAQDNDEICSSYSNIVSYEIKQDTDGDGMPDKWEEEFSLDPLVDDSDEDPDSDGLSNLSEYQNNTDPTDSDTDGDNLTDGEEVNTYGTDPTDSDTDVDGLTDWDEIITYGTDPTDSDTDDDSLTDWDEVITYGTDPTDSDTDGDGLTDGEEVITYGTDPTDSDTDGDGYSDYDEVNKGTNPTDSNSYPTTDSTENSTSNSSSALFSLDFSSFAVFLSVLMIPVFIRLTYEFRRKQN